MNTQQTTPTYDAAKMNDLMESLNKFKDSQISNEDYCYQTMNLCKTINEISGQICEAAEYAGEASEKGCTSQVETCINRAMELSFLISTLAGLIEERTGMYSVVGGEIFFYYNELTK